MATKRSMKILALVYCYLLCLSHWLCCTGLLQDFTFKLKRAMENTSEPGDLDIHPTSAVVINEINLSNYKRDHPVFCELKMTDYCLFKQGVNTTEYVGPSLDGYVLYHIGPLQLTSPSSTRLVAYWDLAQLKFGSSNGKLHISSPRKLQNQWSRCQGKILCMILTITAYMRLNCPHLDTMILLASYWLFSPKK